ncbi:short-chain dehydrogenase [Sorangium cellulosum]|uniref:Short-chain dehydrogenase n=1 Tax=Sorangium cellulosum TaxID=56 RepID=A0A2L0EI83_SORCE|nr:SDR family NAD(P)-dependent oxidoreductase [Sorangium cellulosum]AUX39009.1 short-chain dehydrogenase [Sorangium cellulosum]
MNTALVTGASSGVGLELTRKVLTEGGHVIALIRSDLPAGEAALEEAQRAGRLRIYRTDLEDFAKLRASLAEIRAKEARIDVLFNNAGVSLGAPRSSPQGRDVHFDVNTVAPYVIVRELRPLLEAGRSRTVVNTSSNAMLFVKRFDPDQLEKGTEFRKLFGPYAASKLALSLWTAALAADLARDGIEIRSVHPGGIKSTMTRSSGMPFWLLPIAHLFFAPPSRGASRLHDVAFGRFRGKSGVFVNEDREVPVPFSDHADAVLAKVRSIYERELLDGRPAARAG